MSWVIESALEEMAAAKKAKQWGDYYQLRSCFLASLSRSELKMGLWFVKGAGYYPDEDSVHMAIGEIEFLLKDPDRT